MEVVVADLDLRRALDDFSPAMVYHLAALHFIPECVANPEKTLEVNVGGTETLCRLLAGRPVEALVFTSTAAVYRSGPGPHTEDAPLQPMEVYGESKLAGEAVLRAHAEKSGQPCAIARLFNVYGPGETNPHVIPEIIEQLRAGSKALALGNTSPQRDYIHVGDVARALIQLARCAGSQLPICNVGSGVGTSVAELVAICEQVLERPIRIETDVERVRAVDRPVLVADNSRLRELTGWAPQMSLFDGFRGLLLDSPE